MGTCPLRDTHSAVSLGKIGVVSALHVEVRSLTGRPIQPVREVLACGNSGAIIVSGIGDENAERAISALLEYGVTALVSWGVAGGLDRELHAGDLVIPDAVIAADGTRLPFTAGWRDQIVQRLDRTPLIVRQGSLAHTAAPLRTLADKAHYQQRTGADAVDMESIAVARCANTHRMPCVAVRAIVDDATDTLPELITKHSDPFGVAKHSAIIMALLTHPHLIPVALRLGSHMRRAVSTLRTVAHMGIPFTS